MKKKVFTSIFTVVVLLAVTLTSVMATPPGTWMTDVTMFNIDTVNSANVTFTKFSKFTGGSADTGTDVPMAGSPIAPGGSLYYNPGSDPAFGAGFDGSVVLSSDVPLAAIVGVANNFTGTAYASDTYGGIANTSTKVILPILMAKLGSWNTRISIQNAGTNPTDITVSYVGANKPSSPTTVTALPAGQVARLDQYDLVGVTNFNGSAIVTTSGEPVAVTVEEYRTTGGVLITYTGIPDTDADTTIYMPGYIDQGVWGSDFTIVNTESVAAPITVSFAGSASTLTGTIPADGAVYFNRTSGVPAGFSGAYPRPYYGSATIVSTGGKLVVQYNISNNVGGPANANEGYVGMPSTAGKNTVIIPLIENMYSSGWETTFTVQNVEGGTANLQMFYAGNLTPVCNPCTDAITTGQTYVQSSGTHVPAGFIGGVRIVSDKKIIVIGDQANFKSASYKAGDTAGGFAGFGQ